MTVQPLQRHSLVWLDPGLDLASCAVSDHAEAVGEWISQGLPLVAARQVRPQDLELCSLGLTLPPPATRQRVALTVPAAAIVRQSAPLPLQTVLEKGDKRCRELIQEIVAVCQAMRVTPHIYGSMMWQTVSGRPFMTATSDLDLLFRCDDSTDVRGLLDALVGLEGSDPRIDGEILASSGWASAWREVAAAARPGGPGTVLAKSDHEARVLSLDDFWGRKDD